MSTPSPATLPRGLVARGDQVTLSYGPVMHVLVWFAALLPIAIAVLMAVHGRPEHHRARVPRPAPGGGYCFVRYSDAAYT